MNIEFDLKEILVEFKQEFAKIDARFDKIDTKFDRLEEKIDKVSDDLNAFKTKSAEDFGTVRADIARLDEKVEGLGKRIDTQEFINHGGVVGLLLALLGGFAKIFGFVS